MLCAEQRRILSAKEARQHGGVDRTEVNSHLQVAVTIDVLQRWLFTEDAAVHRLAEHHGRASCTVIGASGTVLFDPTTKLGVHQHDGVCRNVCCHGAEQCFQTAIHVCK
jgi:hypothetical protein